MGLQATWRQRNLLVTETRHARYHWRVHVSARSSTVRALLNLALPELAPLKLQNTFLTDDFLALIAHLSVVQLEFMAD